MGLLGLNLRLCLEMWLDLLLLLGCGGRSRTRGRTARNTWNGNEIHSALKISAALRVVLGPCLNVRVSVSCIRVVNVGRARLLLLG